MFRCHGAHANLVPRGCGGESLWQMRCTEIATHTCAGEGTVPLARLMPLTIARRPPCGRRATVGTRRGVAEATGPRACGGAFGATRRPGYGRRCRSRGSRRTHFASHVCCRTILPCLAVGQRRGSVARVLHWRPIGGSLSAMAASSPTCCSGLVVRGGPTTSSTTRPRDS